MTVLRWLPLVAAAALGLMIGGLLLATTFMVYDDEGYVLFSLRTFCELGALYDKTYSQYGPFYFLFYQALHLLGLEFTTFDGRLVTLACWVSSAGLCASLVWRITRSHAATIFTLTGVVLHLRPLASEPSHPGGLITLLVSFAAWAGCRWAQQPRAFAIVAGAIGAALVLTKINVGIFLIVAAGTWWAAHLPLSPANARWRTGLLGAGLALLPLALMRAHAGSAAAQGFAFASAVAGLTTALAVARNSQPLTRWSNLLPFILAFAIAAALVVGLVMVQGTSGRNLLEGVLMGPLRHPSVYAVLWPWSLTSLGIAAAMLVAGLWATCFRPEHAPIIVPAIRWICGGGLIIGLIGSPPRGSDMFVFFHLTSAVWAFAHPSSRNSAGCPQSAWLALLLVTQVLHAYPVAGSQISWGTFLIVPLIAVGIHALVREQLQHRGPKFRGLVRFAAALLIAGSLVRSAHAARDAASRIVSSDALRLPGTLLYLPENLTTALRILSRNVVAHADVLFTMPGLLSFHLWTDVPPPTSNNATHWFTLLSPAQQAEIEARLKASPRACIVMQRYLYDFLVQERVPTRTPLSEWLFAHYEPAFEVDTYQFLVRKGRTIAPLGAATLHYAEHVANTPKKISITIGGTAHTKVHSIELREVVHQLSVTKTVWNNDEVHMTLTPLSASGAATGPAQEVRFPFSARGFSRLEIYTTKFPESFPLGAGVLALRDEDGRRIDEARFVR